MVAPVKAGSQKFSQLPLGEVRTLLYSRIHEERLVALLILAWRYGTASSREKEDIVKFYLDHIKQVNNWDLVDLSAPNILGAHLVDRDNRQRRLLYRLTKSENVWERRIAILATYHFIRNG
jgi:3-methyladenine DNA glycosylase AlkD